MSDSGRKTSALIVEDDEVAAMQLKKTLSIRFSMEVVLVRDYTQARLKLDSRDFDIVTVDYTLPGGEGARLAEEITAGKDHPPVILVGGRADESAARSLYPHVSGYVVKDAYMEEGFASAVAKGLAEKSIKRAERALSGEQSFIEAALNALPDTFFVLKLDGSGIRWNRRLGEVTGYTDEEIASMTPSDFFRGEDLERVTGIVSKVATGELESASVEATLHTRDGRAIPYEYFASLLKDASGAPESICGVGRDISERKRAETADASTRLSLEALVGERTELLWEANQKLAREVDERKRAQEELKKKERYFRSIVENSTDFIGVFDARGTLLYISPSVTGILGYEVDEILGQNAFEYVHPDDLASMLQVQDSVVSGAGMAEPANCRFLLKDGNWHILEATGRTYVDDSGEVRVVVNGRDITEQKAMAEELKASRDNLAAFLDATTSVAMLIDADGTIIAANRAMADLGGMTVEELVGTSMYEEGRLPPDIQRERVARVKEVFEKREALVFEDESFGMLFEHRLYPVLGSGGVVERVAIFAHDVTARRHAEEEIRRSRDSLSAFLGASTDMALLLELDGTILEANEACAKAFGRSVEELHGSNTYDFFPKASNESRRAMLEEAVASRVPLSFSEESRGKHYEHRLYPVVEADGSVERVAIFVRDVTEEKKAERALLESRNTALTFMNATVDMTLLLDLEGNILGIGEATAELLGVTVENARGSNIDALLPPDVVEARMNVIKEIGRTGKPGLFEDEFGGIIYDHRMHPVFGEGGEVIAVTVNARDVTEQRRAEEEVRESRDNLAAFLNATTDYAMLIGADGRILAVNRALAARLGTTADALEGLSMYEKADLPESVQSGRVARVKEVFAKGEPVSFEDFRDGMHFDHRLYPVFDSRGNVDRVAFFSRDITERKAAEAALKQSEAQFRTLVEQLPVVVYTSALDETSTSTYVSPQVETLLGIAPDAWTSRQDLFVERIHPDDRERVLAELAHSHRSGKRFVSEYRMIAEDGRIVFVRDEATVINDDAGRPMFMQGVMSDVTARRIAEQALRDSEEKFRLHFENSSDVIYALDSEFRITTISPSIERLLGYSPAELEGKKFPELNLLAPSSVERAVSDTLRIISGERVTATYEFVAKDGTARYGEITGSPLRRNGDIVGVISVARDVTGRVQAEESLKQSEERYRSIYAVTPDYVYLMDTDGILLDANPAVLERLGTTLEKFRGTNFIDYFAGDDPSELAAVMERLRSGEEVRGFEVRAGVPPDIYVYEINASPLFENGRVTKILSLARDITERKKDEEELVRLNRELDGYAQTVSHDLRTPLSAIKLAGETMQKVWTRREELDLDLDAEVKRFSEIIEMSTVKAEALIADLLSLARAGKEPLEVLPVNVRDAVRMLLAERDSLVRDRGAWVEVDEDLGTIWANPTHIQQLFGNIVDNALKHNTAPSPAIEIRYLGKSATGSHQYRVKDNGPGIPPAILDEVFLPFVKGEMGETGIGLAIVERIVNLYGGTINAYNSGGAVLEFYLKDIMPPPDDA